jgi:hypothetical protein
VLIEDKAAVKAAKGDQPKQQRKRSDQQTLALKALNSLAADIGKAPPASFGLPKGLLAVTIEQWREELFSRGIISTDHKSPREAFKRLRTSLEARGDAAERDGLIWPARLA